MATGSLNVGGPAGGGLSDTSPDFPTTSPEPDTETAQGRVETAAVSPEDLKATIVEHGTEQINQTGASEFAGLDGVVRDGENAGIRIEEEPEWHEIEAIDMELEDLRRQLNGNSAGSQQEPQTEVVEGVVVEEEDGPASQRREEATEKQPEEEVIEGTHEVKSEGEPPEKGTPDYYRLEATKYTARMLTGREWDQLTPEEQAQVGAKIENGENKEAIRQGQKYAVAQLIGDWWEATGQPIAGGRRTNAINAAWAQMDARYAAQDAEEVVGQSTAQETLPSRGPGESVRPPIDAYFDPETLNTQPQPEFVAFIAANPEKPTEEESELALLLQQLCIKATVYMVVAMISMMEANENNEFLREMLRAVKKGLIKFDKNLQKGLLERHDLGTKEARENYNMFRAAMGRKQKKAGGVRTQETHETPEEEDQDQPTE